MLTTRQSVVKLVLQDDQLGEEQISVVLHIHLTPLVKWFIGHIKISTYGLV
jgi:hypothetical protein